MGQVGLRKGLGNWDAVKDVAMAGGLDSSVDLSPVNAFSGTEQSGTIEFLAHRIRLQPRTAEAGVLSKLEEQIDKLLAHNFGDVDAVIAKFFDQVESSSKMEPGELERVILSIQKVVYVGTDVVTDLYRDAYFADRVQQDEYWAAYRTDDLASKATIGDRQAYAYDKSQDSRFFYYYSFLVWQKVSKKLDTLRDLQRTLEFQRNRTQKDRYA